MTLHELLHAFDPRLNLTGLANPRLRGIAEDSRLVQPGDLFIARPGLKTDGAKFVADAQARGAVAVISQSRLDTPLPQVVINDVAAAMSPLANMVHGDPSRQVRVVGVTGTNGKTTTAYLVRHLLQSVKQRCGMIGTVEIDDGQATRPAAMTTPSAVEIAGLLAAMRDHGCGACAMEVSSHALDQNRVSAVRFAGAAFTNLTGDHLDYHGTMDNYAAAKSKLFAMLSDDTVAVVNERDEYTARMVRDCKARVMPFGIGPGTGYRACDWAITSKGTSFILLTPDGQAEVRVGMIGKHNIENILTAAGLVGEVFGLTAHQIAAGLRDAIGAPGRLQMVRLGQPFAVLVDYAHTDDALQNVLSALRPLCKGQLRVLFGCGGDRDHTKRPRMAAVAAKLADAVYITSDNPRTEVPEAIIEDILAGLTGKQKQAAVVQVDRRQAIAQIITDAHEGDIVLLAGKGHEDYQIIGTVKHHFDDVEEASRVLTTIMAESV